MTLDHQQLDHKPDTKHINRLYLILTVKIKGRGGGGGWDNEVGYLNASLKMGQQIATIEAVQNDLYQHIASVIN